MALDYNGLTNPLTPTDYPPYGGMKDNPGDGTGTVANAALINDGWQFFQYLLDQSGVAPNLTPEGGTNFQLPAALRIWIESGYRDVGQAATTAWTDAGSGTGFITTSGGGLSAISVLYNRWKIKGSTLYWSVSFTFTSTGAVSQIILANPLTALGTTMGFTNNGGIIPIAHAPGNAAANVANPVGYLDNTIDVGSIICKVPNTSSSSQTWNTGASQQIGIDFVGEIYFG